MIHIIKKYINIIWILFIIFALLSPACFGQNQAKNEFEEIYIVGRQIAEGVSLSILTGLSALDQKLQYSFETKRDIFTYRGNTWPILDVILKTESQKIGNTIITYVLLLEVDQNSQIIAGTVKNIRANGEVDESLNILNNTIYIETKEGTEQVQYINGQLSLVE